MEVLAVVVLVLAVLLGLMFTLFTVLNLFADLPSNPFGTFGVKFIYEMDEVMGGLLGIPHYSKIEAMLLAVGAVGAWLAVFTSSLLVPCFGFICGTAYMVICGFYGHFAGTGAAAFLVMACVSGVCLYAKAAELAAAVADESAGGTPAARFASTGSAAGDLLAVQIFGGVMCVLTALSAVIMFMRNTPERAEFNRRFVKVSKWCDENKDFVWLPGKDLPEGFSDESLMKP